MDAFLYTHKIFYACCLFSWNLSRPKIYLQFKLGQFLQDACQCVCYHPSGHYIAVGFSVGKWVVLDALTREVVIAQYEGSTILGAIDYSPGKCYYFLGKCRRTVMIPLNKYDFDVLM